MHAAMRRQWFYTPRWRICVGPTMQRLLPVSLLALVLTSFAGCVGGEGSPEATGLPGQAGPAVFDETLGAIEGFVFDTETVPIASADIAILGQDGITTQSAADGGFTLNNVPPGKHVLVAQKLGYEAVSRSIEVVAGAATEATLVLIPIAVIDSYHQTLPFKGFFDCTWSNPTGSGPCGYIGQTNGTTGNPLQSLQANSRRKWNWPIAANSLTILHEITWSQASLATGEKMATTMSHGPINGKERDGTHNFCTAAGKDPVRLHWERQEFDGVGECLSGRSQYGTTPGPKKIDEKGMLMQSFVSTGNGANPATGGDLPAGLAYQQSFELYITVFYGEVAPEGFSALKEG